MGKGEFMEPYLKRVLAGAATLLLAAGLVASPPEGVEQQIAQMETDWAEAAMKHDPGVVDRVVADDWVGIWFDGSSVTKAQLLDDIKSGAMSTQSITVDPVKVRVFGDTAVATGGDTEKSSYKGQDSSGRYAWTDVYVKRNGKWQAVASQVTKTAMAHQH